MEQEQTPESEQLVALRAAANVLFLLTDEIDAMGLRAKNVLEMVRGAIESGSAE